MSVSAAETEATQSSQPTTTTPGFAAALGLALFCGVVSQKGPPGSIIALPAGLLLMLILRRRADRQVAFAAAASWLAVLVSPGPLALSVHWLCLAALMLSTNGVKLSHAADATVVPAAVASLFAGPFRAIRQWLMNQPSQAAGNSWLAGRATLLFLPVLATLTFSFLLVSANPLFEQLLTVVAWQRLLAALDWLVIFASGVALLLILAIRHIRPMQHAIGQKPQASPGWHGVLFNPAAVMLTMVLLNLLFLVENGLDANIIWLARELPAGMTHAQYVHRGSYTLICTAILAALLATAAMRPGSATEASPLVRKLVYGWMLQNMFLVASSASRTFSYISDYGMSMWRLSGLIWMGIVAVGLGLVMLRLRRSHSSLWLTNANLAVCLVVLLSCCFIDLRWVVAEWNASAAIERRGAWLDQDYLESLGPSAIPALLRLERAGVLNASPCLSPGQIAIPTLLPAITIPLRERQAHWQTASLRDAYYLHQLEAAVQDCGERR